jgi:hypothetical protein
MIVGSLTFNKTDFPSYSIPKKDEKYPVLAGYLLTKVIPSSHGFLVALIDLERAGARWRNSTLVLLD